MTPPPAIADPFACLPPGSYAAGISGGCDSTAMLMLLLHARPDVGVHVVHLNHQLRGPESDADAEFVRNLAMRFNLSHTIALRSDVETTLSDLPANASARYRAVRLALYRQVVQEHQLDGVLLAHHADDQAETIMLRLLRGSPPSGLGAMRIQSVVQGLRIFRPLLTLPKSDLAEFLLSEGEPWREDASNASRDYARNCVRKVLADHPDLMEPLIDVGLACRRLQTWTREASPRLPKVFAAEMLDALPSILARQSAQTWLVEQGVPLKKVSPAAVQRLRGMAGDSATPTRQEFPGRVTVARRQGKILTIS